VAVSPGVAPSVDLKQTWAFVTESAFGDLALAVHLEPALEPASRNAIAAALKSKGLARFVDDASGADLVIGRGSSGSAGAPDGIQVRTAVDGVFVGGAIARSPAMATAVRDRVEDYARNRYLRRISLHSREVDVRLTIVPATHAYEESVRGRTCTGSNTGEPGRAARLGSAERTWQLAAGDGFLLQFQNRGKRPAHVAVLELYPDGRIGQMFPLPDQRAAEARLEPGQEVLIRDACFSASPPYGAYVYKLFATDATSRDSRPIDFRPVLTRERNESRGTLGPFEQLLDSTYATTRSDQTTVAVDSGSTDAILVKVVPRQAP
jgi:hypothetical protein